MWKLRYSDGQRWISSRTNFNAIPGVPQNPDPFYSSCYLALHDPEFVKAYERSSELSGWHRTKGVTLIKFDWKTKGFFGTKMYRPYFENNTYSELDRPLSYYMANDKMMFSLEGKAQPVKGIVIRPLIVNYSEYLEYVRQTKPYMIKWLAPSGELYADDIIRLSAWAIVPVMEILSKAGYAFADSYLCNAYGNTDRESDVTVLGRLINLKGTNPANILKCDPKVSTFLKDSTNLMEWDKLRILVKQHPDLTLDDLELIKDMFGTIDNELDKFRQVLGAMYQDKQIFSIHSLIAYLRRIDQFEAIDTIEGVTLLKDYLKMCKDLEIEPKIDGDSLKREHDVIARIHRLRAREISRRLMEEASKEAVKYNYDDNHFFVTAVTTYDALLDEATQQHNCVLSYADSIAKKRCCIFSVRSKSRPDKTLITVETDPRCTFIRQKFYSYNRSVTNPAHLAFLEKWMSFCESERTGLIAV